MVPVAGIEQLHRRSDQVAGAAVTPSGIFAGRKIHIGGRMRWMERVASKQGRTRVSLDGGRVRFLDRRIQLAMLWVLTSKTFILCRQFSEA